MYIEGEGGDKEREIGGEGECTESTKGIEQAITLMS